MRYSVVAQRRKRRACFVVKARSMQQAQRKARRRLGKRYVVNSIMETPGKPIKGSKATRVEKA